MKNISINKQKGKSGVKFLKLDIPLFQNTQCMNSQRSAKNESSANKKLGSINKQFLKSSIKDVESQNPLRNSNIINKQFIKYKSIDKPNIIKRNDLLSNKDSIKLKKEGDLPLSKLDDITNQIKILNRKIESAKNMIILNNKNMKKTLYLLNNNNYNINNDNINNIRNNSSKNKKIDDINQITKIKDENNNTINVNCYNKEKTIKDETDVTNKENGDKEKNKKKSNKFKKIFCCL